MAKLNVKGFDKVSPKGNAQWVRVFEADDYGKFTANLVCNPEDDGVKEFKQLIDGLADKVKQETKKKSIIVPYTEDDEGNLVFKAKLPAVDKDGNNNKVDVVDAQKKPVGKVAIGNGSTIRLMVYVMPYNSGANTGVSLRLKKLQLLELVEYGEDFEEEEGFTGNSSNTKSSHDASEEDEDF